MGPCRFKDKGYGLVGKIVARAYRRQYTTYASEGVIAKCISSFIDR